MATIRELIAPIRKPSFELAEAVHASSKAFAHNFLPAISQKMLTRQLRALGKDCLVSRTEYPGMPSRRNTGHPCPKAL